LGKHDSSYWVHPGAQGFRGENSRHTLTADFTKQGPEIRSRNLRWSLETRAYGYGNALHSAKPVAPQANANRVEYRRDGLTEWYENGPLGLEQGFTLAHRPGKVNGKPLTLELALRGDLVASLQPGEKALSLSSHDGKAALRYTGLKATDTTGRELRSWLEMRGQRLLVRVEDKGARYPVTVDPWIELAELTAPDGEAYDRFGLSVAANGSTIVVGAPGHAVGSNSYQGAAYVFVQSGTTWSQQAELTASDGAASDGFGSSVAVSGSTIAVGAPSHQVGANFDQGAAYAFVQSGTTWSQQAELTASDGAASDLFGRSVAVSGSTIVVGALGHQVGANSDQGAAYAFAQSGTTWSQQAELTASDGAQNDQFGWSVSVSGSTIAVGAPRHQVGSNSDQGAAYVFVPNGTTWSQQAELTASDGAQNDLFGQSVAASGSTIVVGAPGHAVGSNSYQGAAYVFVPNGTTWSQQAELTASDGAQNDEFGQSVAASGSTIVVGAPNFAVGSSSNQGAAYVFSQSGTTWSQQAELTASDGAQNDNFGSSVSVSDSTIIVGAPNHAVGSNSYQGAAYVFSQTGAGSYALSASPNSLSMTEGGQGTSTITITPQDGFSGSVLLAASGLPSGVTASFSPNPATSTSTLTLAASSTATTGTSTVTVTGISGDEEQAITLTLTVTGTTVTLTPTSLSFVDQAVNSTSTAKTVMLKNTGTVQLNISGIAVTLGTNFAISNNTCGATLAVGKTCKVSVTFTPTQLGSLTDTLVFTDSAISSPQAVSLSGTGEVQVTLTPSSYTFRTTKVGDTSAAHAFTLKNNLPTPLTGISFSTAAPFAVSASTCGTTLDSKKSCTISVTFSPTATGAATGTLTVDDSANDSPQTSSLSGTGD
jgi:nucleoside-specific outer membrane channel protein Tsx